MNEEQRVGAVQISVRRMGISYVTLGLALAIGGCSVEQVKKADPEVSATSHVILYPAIDSELGEHPYLNEKPIAQLAVASDMSRTTRQQMFNPRKLVVAQSVAPHRSLPKRRLPMNHALPDSRIP